MIDMLLSNIRMLDQAFRGHPRDRARVAGEQAEAANLKQSLDAIDRRWPGCGGRSSESPVFLLSAGWRAGSTLMQRMLAKDEGVLIWGEPFHNSNILDGMTGQLKAFRDNHPNDSFFLENMGKDESGLAESWIANLWPSVRELIDGHYAFFDKLYAEPARRYGRQHWGLKEVRLGAEHAQYLRWLYPQAKIIFLCRNPYNAYASYSEYVGTAYWRWPDRPILTARQFGNMWCELTEGYLAEAQNLDAVFVQYEKLGEADTHKALCDYLEMPLPTLAEMGRVRSVKTDDTFTPKARYISAPDRFLLRRAVGQVARDLGYEGLSRNKQ